MENQIDLHEELESGKYLFKYARLNTNSLQTIINHTLYFSSPKALNDPLDSKFKIRINNPQNFTQKTKLNILNSRFELNDNIKYLTKNFGITNGDIEKQEKLFNAFFQHYQNVNAGVCCFSLTGDDNLMWSHYASEAKGLCFVFDKEQLRKSLLANIDRTRYRLMADPLKYRGVKTLDIKLLKDGTFVYSMNHLFSKTKHWKYEKEYRFVLERNRIDLFDFSSYFNPYLKFDKEVLKFVIVGEQIEKVHFEMLEKLLENSDVKIIGHTYNS